MSDSSDNSLIIGVGFQSDTSGIKPSMDQLAAMKAALTHDTAEAGQAGKKVAEEDITGTEQTISRKHELRAVLRLLGYEFSALGGLVHYLFNPWTLALGGILFLTRLVHAANEKLKQTMEANATAAADMFKAVSSNAAEVSKQASEAATKFKETFDSLSTAQNTADTKTNRVIQTIKSEEAALLRLKKVQEEFELAGATTEEARREIRSRYAGASEAIKTQASEKEIAAKQAQIERALFAQPQLAKATAAAMGADSGEEGAKRRYEILLRQQDKTRLGKQLKEAELQVEKYRGGDPTKWTKAVTDRNQIQPSLTETLQLLGGLDTQDKTARDKVAAARQAELDNQKTVQRLMTELPQLRGQLGLEQATTAAESAYRGAEPQIEAYSRNVELLASAVSRLNPAGMAQAIEQLAAWPDQMTRMIDSINRANEGFQNAIYRLDSTL